MIRTVLNESPQFCHQFYDKLSHYTHPHITMAKEFRTNHPTTAHVGAAIIEYQSWLSKRCDVTGRLASARTSDTPSTNKGRC